MQDISAFLQDPMIRQSILSMMQQRHRNFGGAMTPGEATAANSVGPGMGLMDLMRNGGGLGLMGMMGRGQTGGLASLFGGGGGAPAVPRDVMMTQPM